MKKPVKIRCLVVDDEHLGRKLMEENIRQIPFLEWVASCKNAFEAMDVLRQQKIDLMFLDIQMPGMLGTTFLQSLHEKPMVILVTAYSDYALEGYELDVLDYLVKPVSLERFVKAAYKALNAYSAPGEKKVISPLEGQVEKSPEPFFVNVEYSLVRIIPDQVMFLAGMKDYVKIYLIDAAKPVITKATIKSIEEKLPSDKFMRVHKSFVVNLSCIESIRGNQLKLGKFEIPVSESHRQELFSRLKYKP